MQLGHQLVVHSVRSGVRVEDERRMWVWKASGVRIGEKTWFFAFFGHEVEKDAAERRLLLCVLAFGRLPVLRAAKPNRRADIAIVFAVLPMRL